MTLNLLILTSWFAITPEDIKEGVGHRYVGLYGSLVKTVNRRSPDSKVYWYSHRDQSLRIITQGECKKLKKSMPNAIMKAISDTLKNQSSLAVIIAYPSAVPGIKRVFEYVCCLLILKIFSVGHVKTFADDFDPPVEAAYAFSKTRPSIADVAYKRLLEMLTLKMTSFTITINGFWRQFLARTYQVREDKILVISNGSLVKYVKCNSRTPRYPITILYAGSAMKVKDIDKLVSAVEKSRIQGMDVDLYIAGAKLMDLPSWVRVTQCKWPIFVVDILLQSDICVIPYSPNSFTFFHSMPAKLFDYMAAGKPVISTDLKEVGDIIRSNNCGLIAKDWIEFEVHLKRLCEDKELATKLGNNGRAAIEKYFDYERLAQMFLEHIIEQLR